MLWTVTTDTITESSDQIPTDIPVITPKRTPTPSPDLQSVCSLRRLPVVRHTTQRTSPWPVKVRPTVFGSCLRVPTLPWPTKTFQDRLPCPSGVLVDSPVRPCTYVNPVRPTSFDRTPMTTTSWAKVRHVLVYVHNPYPRSVQLRQQRPPPKLYPDRQSDPYSWVSQPSDTSHPRVPTLPIVRQVGERTTRPSGQITFQHCLRCTQTYGPRVRKLDRIQDPSTPVPWHPWYHHTTVPESLPFS